MSTPAEELREQYGRAFYDELAGDVRRSAEVIVPLVVAAQHPRSVLDVGCGVGTWLDVFRTHGVDDVVGVDGPHVVLDQLEIPRDAFVAHDLREPLDLGRRFDLVVSLEVAEHLAPDRADAFVASLVAHAPAVLFSAAIPFQGGTGHVNERWPSYWADRFAGAGFAPLDIVRPAVWRDDRVAFWYAQNTLLYVEDANVGAAPLDLVHPALHVRDHTVVRNPAPPSLRRALRDVPRAAWHATRHRLGRR
jgi:SAM-dependent methyltransferase